VGISFYLDTLVQLKASQSFLLLLNIVSKCMTLIMTFFAILELVFSTIKLIC